MDVQVQPRIAVVEFGSQHTLQIVRTLRELGHHSIVVRPEGFDRAVMGKDILCVIGSGGLRSVYENGAPQLSALALPHQEYNSFPYLGICYGMQTSMHQQGGVVAKGVPEYAQAFVELEPSPLFDGLSNLRQRVWMSHGDSVTEVPGGFQVLGRSESGHIAAVGNERLRHYGVQFHPEVEHTPEGRHILQNFVQNICHCPIDYAREDMPGVIEARIAALVEPEEHALLLFSGGVDSTTVAALAAKALGERLHAITFDAGHLREGEVDEIKRNATLAGVDLTVIDCAESCIRDISRTLDPELKRAAFRSNYARLTREAAKRFGATKIIQGTIAPDRIESGMTGGARIKTHHNSAGLDFGDLIEVHPIEDLFKDEVRALSRAVGLPQDVFNRPPFPGPGNFLRVVNIPVTREALSAVQWAEARVRDMASQDPRYCNMSQVVVAVVGRAVGVKGDNRAFGYMIAVRGVRTKDFMTAEGVAFEPNFQKWVSQKLCEHPAIVQVGFFPTDKPPGTTEFE